ncbi:hypothetical protein JK358_10905 [Nocardia sp. 2]|uniref:Nuclear transport factor 2 family protein n=1 Tax=Nocardia acididurans TaxID=2802282 RepID=A0ABS1M3J6_9NOCA|nr:hypothetical protein [Nocardia acididurans]MBL1074901.1 hypothetical protein [Nocardia acididurans]
MTLARRLCLALGVGALTVIVTACGTAAAGKDSATDDQRIETAAREFYDTLAADGPSVAAARACEPDRTEFDSLPADQKAAVDRGKFTIKITSVDDIVITGDRATAGLTGTLTLPGAEGKSSTTAQHFRKENGTWKVCSADGK